MSSPLDLSRLLEGRTNAEREAGLARHLQTRGVPFARHPFADFEACGESFSVDVGSGDRVLLLVAHHDAVLGSPGANDNAAGVGILLHLLERVAQAPPSRVRVRCLFTGAEELGYLGARAYVGATALGDVAGVLSLELCGIGDSLVVWDAVDATPFLERVGGALRGLGLERDAGYHLVGRIPLFGSDHRAFAAAGIPAYGLTVVPAAEAAALREFIFHPVRGALRYARRRPAPFDTYHTARDTGATLQAGALEATVRALEAVIAEVS